MSVGPNPLAVGPASRNTKDIVFHELPVIGEATSGETDTRGVTASDATARAATPGPIELVLDTNVMLHAVLWRSWSGRR